MEHICRFYERATATLPASREHHQHQQVESSPRTYQVPWCSHKHSAATQPQARATGGKLLRCQGALAKCQVDRGKFDDQ